MKRVFDVPLAIDLSELAAFLWQQEIPHRIIEEDERQALYVPPHVNAQQVYYLYEQWKQGAELKSIRVEPAFKPRLYLKEFPCTLALLVVSLLVSLGISFGNQYSVMHWLTITDFTMQGNSLIYTHLQETLISLQWWRFLTPVFMHFSLPHLVFNALWVWVMGRRIEKFQGPFTYLGLVIGAGVVSNIAQFWVSGPMFGGLSGVVFAILAYCWLWDKLAPYPLFGMPPALMGLMLVWLVLGYTGTLQLLGLGAIANTAHLAGLLVGLAGVPLVRLFRSKYELR